MKHGKLRFLTSILCLVMLFNECIHAREVRFIEPTQQISDTVVIESKRPLFTESVLQFLGKHKIKIALGILIGLVVGIGAYYFYARGYNIDGVDDNAKQNPIEVKEIEKEGWKIPIPEWVPIIGGKSDKQKEEEERRRAAELAAKKALAFKIDVATTAATTGLEYFGSTSGAMDIMINQQANKAVLEAIVDDIKEMDSKDYVSVAKTIFFAIGRVIFKDSWILYQYTSGKLGTSYSEQFMAAQMASMGKNIPIVSSIPGATQYINVVTFTCSKLAHLMSFMREEQKPEGKTEEEKETALRQIGSVIGGLAGIIHVLFDVPITINAIRSVVSSFARGLYFKKTGEEPYKYLGRIGIQLVIQTTFEYAAKKYGEEHPYLIQVNKAVSSLSLATGFFYGGMDLLAAEQAAAMSFQATVITFKGLKQFRQIVHMLDSVLAKLDRFKDKLKTWFTFKKDQAPAPQGV